MSTPRRRRKDQETPNQIVGALHVVPTAMGDILNPVESVSREPTEDEIARRAYQLYEEGGGQHCHDWEDWFQAERELRELALHAVIDRALATQGPYAAA